MMVIEKIYFDMDCVLADFNRGVRELCQLSVIPYEQKTEAQDDEMWDAIREVGPFYDKLEPVPGALELFKMVYEKYGDRCEILTGIPKERRGIVTAGSDKTAWAHRLLSPDIVVNIVYAEDKKNFCTGESCVLIDDYKRNIDEWTGSGGTGLLFTSSAQMTNLLREKGIL